MSALTARRSRDVRHVVKSTVRRVLALAQRQPDPTVMDRELDVGPDTYLAPGVVIDPGFWWLFSMGAESRIAPDVLILMHDASTRQTLGYTKVARVVIGERVFVGARSIILPGVSIGDDAIVAAGSVVRTDVAPGALVGGNPAREMMRASDYLARQAGKMAGRPKFDRSFTNKGGISRAQREQMCRELEDGVGFVK